MSLFTSSSSCHPNSPVNAELLLRTIPLESVITEGSQEFSKAVSRPVSLSIRSVDLFFDSDGTGLIMKKRFFMLFLPVREETVRKTCTSLPSAFSLTALIARGVPLRAMEAMESDSAIQGAGVTRESISIPRQVSIPGRKNFSEKDSFTLRMVPLLSQRASAPVDEFHALFRNAELRDLDTEPLFAFKSCLPPFSRLESPDVLRSPHRCIRFSQYKQPKAESQQH